MGSTTKLLGTTLGELMGLLECIPLQESSMPTLPKHIFSNQIYSLQHITVVGLWQATSPKDVSWGLQLSVDLIKQRGTSYIRR